jgi:histidine triad (HIT) family protein
MDHRARRADSGAVAAAGTCVFCAIVAGAPAHLVWEDDDTVAFLDRRPVFRGHTLVVPRAPIETLADLPVAQVGGFFIVVQRLAVAVEDAMGAEGTFVAINNRVSQSVPHLHCHIVPRTKGDGLRGFFWPRQRYQDDDEMASVAAAIRAAASAPPPDDGPTAPTDTAPTDTTPTDAPPTDAPKR